VDSVARQKILCDSSAVYGLDIKTFEQYVVEQQYVGFVCKEQMVEVDVQVPNGHKTSNNGTFAKFITHCIRDLWLNFTQFLHVAKRKSAKKILKPYL
jgi:hypothetical protein